MFILRKFRKMSADSHTHIIYCVNVYTYILVKSRKINSKKGKSHIVICSMVSTNSPYIKTINLIIKLELAI